MDVQNTSINFSAIQGIEIEYWLLTVLFITNKLIFQSWFFLLEYDKWYKLDMTRVWMWQMI